MVFSHQVQIARMLAPAFSEMTVVTAESDSNESPKGFQVISSDWQEGKRIRNAFRFLRRTLPILLREKGEDLVVFSHMTEVQSFLIAPICWLFGIKHYLWYAHRSRSPYLLLSLPFLTKIITSTQGSCPIKGHKVLAIGQAVEVSEFASEAYPLLPPLRWYYIGRIDPFKKLEVIIEAIESVRNRSGYNIVLNIFGSASSIRTQEYERNLKVKFSNYISEGWLTFNGPIRRSEIRGIALKHDGFINSFFGSLDKTLIEASMSRRFVATTNPEFATYFGRKVQIPDFYQQSLADQVQYFLEIDSNEAKKILDTIFVESVNCHSQEVWVHELTRILKYE